jgi:hypothetical protein
MKEITEREKKANKTVFLRAPKVQTILKTLTATLKKRNQKTAQVVKKDDRKN